jgi:hypothetical protein
LLLAGDGPLAGVCAISAEGGTIGDQEFLVGGGDWFAEVRRFAGV